MYEGTGRSLPGAGQHLPQRPQSKRGDSQAGPACRQDGLICLSLSKTTTTRVVDDARLSARLNGSALKFQQSAQPRERGRFSSAWSVLVFGVLGQSQPEL